MRQIRGAVACAALPLAAAVGVAIAGGAKVSKMALVTIESEIEIQAPLTRVWAALTEKDKAMSWCPMWHKAASAQPLTKVGNTIDYLDDWGTSGKSVVIYVDDGKELRVAHVPTDGSYVCQAKFVLTAKGNATVVKVTEQYSDTLEVPTDKDTAAKSRDEIDKSLAALKALAEKA